VRASSSVSFSVLGLLFAEVFYANEEHRSELLMSGKSNYGFDGLKTRHLNAEFAKRNGGKIDVSDVFGKSLLL